VPPALMSRATSFASMAQQLWMSLGVGMSAFLLHVMQVWKGGTLGPDDFTPVFVANAMIAVAAVLVFLPLGSEAGAELSGHRFAGAPSPERPAE